MSMPIYERRFFLGMLTRKNERQQEQLEASKEENVKSNSKGSRQTKLSGKALKNRLNNGDIPIK